MAETVEVKVVSYPIVEFGCEMGRREELYIDGKEVMSVGPLCECPEDATLDRDLKGPSDFMYLLKEFLEEHKGKEVVFVNEEGEEE